MHIKSSIEPWDCALIALSLHFWDSRIARNIYLVEEKLDRSSPERDGIRGGVPGAVNL